MARWPETAAGSVSTARSDKEASRDLGDPLWSWFVNKTDRVCRMIGIIPEKGKCDREVGFADSTPSAGKPRAWGSGEADEDWL
jgi:hypothetical protein